MSKASEQDAVRIRCIGDEIDADVDAQFSFMAAHGFSEFVGRFFQFGPNAEKKNINEMTLEEVKRLKRRADEAGLRMTCNGTPLLKMEAVPGAGIGAPHMPLPEFRQTVRLAAECSAVMECRMNRVFSLYPPRGAGPQEYVPQAVEYLGAAVEVFESYDQVVGLEIEANLVGRNSTMLAQILNELDRPDRIGILWDPANVVVLPKSVYELRATYAILSEHMVGAHIKDCRKPEVEQWPDDHVPEDALDSFCLPGEGDGDIIGLVRDLGRNWSERSGRAAMLGVEFCLDMEPHLSSGGQYGGTSGPRQVRKAVQALTKLLHVAGLPWKA